MNSLITIMTCLYSRVLDLAKFTYEYAMVSEMLPGWNWMELDGTGRRESIWPPAQCPPVCGLGK